MDSNLKPQISILIPAHGAGEFIDECFKSIAEQEFTDFEVILVDDGCEFNLEQKANTFFRNIKFEIVRSQGKGVSDALNTGLMFCRGEYVARMDSDDVMKSDRLSIQISTLKEHPEIVLLGSNIDFIDEIGSKLTSDKYPENHDEIIMEFTRRNPFAHPSVIYKKNIVMGLGGYRKFFEPAEDLDLWLRVSKVGRLYNVQKSLIQYRIHANQITRKSTHLSNNAVHAVITNFRLSNAGKDQLTVLFQSIEEWRNSIKIQNSEAPLLYSSSLHFSPLFDRIQRFFKSPLWGIKRVAVKIKLIFTKRNLNSKIQGQLQRQKKAKKPTYVFWITCAFIVNPIVFGRHVMRKSGKIFVNVLGLIKNQLNRKKSNEN